MARIALAAGPGGHPAAHLGPCARTRIAPDQVRAALAAAGHQLVDSAPDLVVADVAAPPPVPAGAPLVLVSFDRPTSPWQAIADPADRQAFIGPWGADLDARKRAAMARRADAYADALDDLAAAIEVALHPEGLESPALRYLGSLFNTCELDPGASFELDVEPRPIVLGRGENADVRVASPQVARAHLQLGVTGEQGLTVTDLAGTNGTWLCQPDGETAALVPGKPVRARPGALVMPDGSFRFRVA